MALIYNPSTLPARAVLFGDTAFKIQRIRETDTSKDGTAFSPYWISPVIWRDSEGRLASLNSLTLWSTARAATTGTVQASGDGGVTWKSPTVAWAPPSGETFLKPLTLSFIDVIGSEICFKITFDTTTITLPQRWHADIVVRGFVAYG